MNCVQYGRHEMYSINLIKEKDMHRSVVIIASTMLESR